MDMEEVIREYIASKNEMIWEAPSEIDKRWMMECSEALRSGDDELISEYLKQLENYTLFAPTEFMIQPPFIYLALFRLLKKVEQIHSEVLFEILNYYTIGLVQRHKVTNYMEAQINVIDENVMQQVSVPTFTMELIEAMIEYITLCFENDLTSTMSHKCYRILLKSVSLIMIDQINFAPHTIRCLTLVIPLLQKCQDILAMDTACYEYLCPISSMYFILADFANRILKVIAVNKLDMTDDEADIIMVCVQILTTLLLDCAFMGTYEQVHKSVVKTIAHFDPLFEWRQFSLLNSSIVTAVELLSKSGTLTLPYVLSASGNISHTLYLYNSAELINLLMNAMIKHEFLITDSLTQAEQHQGASKLMLKMLAYPNDEIKLIVYERSAQAVKEFVNNVNKHGNVDVKHYGFIGIPITKNILMEIIYFGTTHKVKAIKTFSTQILRIIWKNELFLNKQFNKLQSIIIESMPIIQCYVPDLLSMEPLQKLLTADVNLSQFQLHQFHLRYLFFKNESQRKEALVYLTKMLEKHDLSVLKLTPDMCILNDPYVLKEPTIIRGFCDNVVDNVIQDMNTTTIATRHYDLLYLLNDLANDSRTCKKLGLKMSWLYLMKLWKNYMADTMTPLDCRLKIVELIPEILLKVVLYGESTRTCLAKSESWYYLTFQTLTKFSDNVTIKKHCIGLMFTVLFENVILTEKVCLRFTKYLPTDKVLHIPIKDNEYKSGELSVWVENVFSDQCLEIMHITRDQKKYQRMLQCYIRSSFANMWFAGQEHSVFKENIVYENYVQFKKMEASKKKIRCTVFSFDRQLVLNHVDFRNRDITSMDSKMKFYCEGLKQDHETVMRSINHIHTSSLNASNFSKTAQHILYEGLKDYFELPPRNSGEEAILNKILSLYSLLVLSNIKPLVFNLTQRMTKLTLPFLTNFQLTTDVYYNYITLITIIIKSEPTSSLHINISQIAFDTLRNILTSKTCKNTMNRRRMIFLMKELFLEHVELGDLNQVRHLIDAVISEMDVYALHSYKGSCEIFYGLMLINIIVKLDGFSMEYAPANLFNAACRFRGHINPAIRAMCWGILYYYTNSTAGVNTLMNAWFYFPYGIHEEALRISTSDKESYVVRSYVSSVLVKLLEIWSEKLKTFQAKSLPLPDVSFLQISLKENEFSEKINKRVFIFYVFNVSEKTVPDMDIQLALLQCNIVEKLIEIKAITVQDIIDNNYINSLTDIFAGLMPPKSPAVIEMYTHIINLLNCCLRMNIEKFYELVSCNPKIIGNIFSLLILRNHSKPDHPITTDVIVAVLEMSTLLVDDPSGYSSISLIATHMASSDLAAIIAYCLRKHAPDHMIARFMNFLHTILSRTGKFSEDRDLFHYFEVTGDLYPYNAVPVAVKSRLIPPQVSINFFRIIYYQMVNIYDSIISSQNLFRKQRWYSIMLTVFLESKSALELSYETNFIDLLLDRIDGIMAEKVDPKGQPASVYDYTMTEIICIFSLISSFSSKYDKFSLGSLRRIYLAYIKIHCSRFSSMELYGIMINALFFICVTSQCNYDNLTKMFEDYEDNVLTFVCTVLLRMTFSRIPERMVGIMDVGIRVITTATETSKAARKQIYNMNIVELLVDVNVNSIAFEYWLQYLSKLFQYPECVSEHNIMEMSKFLDKTMAKETKAFLLDILYNYTYACGPTEGMRVKALLKKKYPR